MRYLIVVLMMLFAVPSFARSVYYDPITNHWVYSEDSLELVKKKFNLSSQTETMPIGANDAFRLKNGKLEKYNRKQLAEDNKTIKKAAKIVAKNKTKSTLGLNDNQWDDLLDALGR